MASEAEATGPPASSAPLEQVHNAPEEAAVSQVIKESENLQAAVGSDSHKEANTINPLESPIQPTPAPAPVAEEAPDPDEDDLSDLDDVLDEFTATNLNSAKSNPLSGPGRPSTNSSTIPSDPFASLGADGLLPDDDDFARSLQAGMAELIGDLEHNPDMQRQFEELVKELGDGATTAFNNETSTSGTQPKGLSSEEDALAALAAGLTGKPHPQSQAEKAKTDASFQESIRATMERMNASSASATEATSSSNAEPDDFLAAMLAEMEKGGAPGLGGEGDEDFSKLLLGTMEQLTNKEILYEPMKELHEKFPAWMELNRETCKKEDLDRYIEQQRLVGEITGKFEEKGYADDKVECREYIVDRMQKMQAAGSPPPDLVGDMNAANEALEGMDQGCAQQ